MSNVLPNGQIRFLSGVPIDLNYENSLDFVDLTAQRTYFLGLTPVHTMLGATRVRDGVIAVNVLSDTILSANYMMFQNENFSSKWFYAFITNIEYVNNNMCHVYYQIDDIQTWMFDVTLEECYIEREHTRTDGLFEHLIDEGIQISDYVTVTKQGKNYTRYVAILYSSADTNLIRTEPSYIAVQNGNLNGLTAKAYDVQDGNLAWLSVNTAKDPAVQADQDWIVANGNGLDNLNMAIYAITAAQQKDTIVALILYPRALIGTASDEQLRTGYKITDRNVVIDSLGFMNFKTTMDLDGSYHPKNNKLYNAPFCIHTLSLSDGQTKSFKPELFVGGDSCSISIIANNSPNPSLMIIPSNYSGNTEDWKNVMTLDAFPQCCVSIDGYLAWCASGGLIQWNASVAKTAVSGLIGAATAGVTQNPVGLISSFANTGIEIGKDMAMLDVYENLPSEIKGNINTQGLTASKKIEITMLHQTAKKDVLKSIDNYLSMFGYKVNRIGTPNRRNRPHYTYIKTKGCKLRGGAPSDAIERIQTIYDNGIRFWVNASEVGNYSTIDNSPS